MCINYIIIGIYTYTSKRRVTMNIMEMSQEELFEVAVKALLKHGNMAEDEIYRAWRVFWGMCINGISAEMVIDGKLGMEWRDGELYFSVNKEGLCKK